MYIVGAGDFGKEIADTIAAIDRAGRSLRVAGYIDDDPSRKGETLNGVRILGDTDALIRISRAMMRGGAPGDAGARPLAVLSVSDPLMKNRLAEKLDSHVIWESVVHPAANVSPYATLGKGVVVQPSVYIGPNAAVGDHAHINALSCIGHDVRIGAFASVMVRSALSGRASLGRCGYIASGVTVLPGVCIGENARIGAGAVVTKDVPADVIAYGAPCKVIRAR
ncbi:MAG: acetyltransferase [Clostridiales Family XIII bacterium]|jgi:sugar O-acyltransferase (sialic acid O-acetyltransferase NeuD family)|nr:acetyltransferase [Clostridiales Family XIII bacterium]